MAKKGIVLSIVNELDLTYISFNMEDPVLGKNLDLRKALVYAIDEEAFRKKFYNGLALNAQGVIPPDVEGYDPNYKNPYKEYNVEKAKEFLSKAGYPGGKGLPTLEFSTLSTSTYRQMAEFYQQAWSAIGVQTKIVTSSWPQFLDKLRNRKAQFWDIAWMGDYPDAENFFQLLYSKNISPGSNQTNYVNKEFDTLYDQAALLPPGQARSNIYHQMRDVLNADVPWILGEHRQGVYLHQGWLENFKMNNTIQTMYKYMRVDTKKKEELKANF
jgi:ABC-type transport system substrate-binding protein